MSACVKTAYRSEDAAKRGAIGVARRNGDPKMRAYRCDECRMWHLSSSAGRTY